MPWKDILTKGVIEIIFVVKFSQNFIWHEDDSNSTTPFDYTYLIFYKALRYCQHWCGLLFYPCQGNARSHTTDKANIVPTPYFLSAFFGELGGTRILIHMDKKLTMKKIVLLIVMCLFTGTVTSFAQITKEQRKQRSEILKASKVELNTKASKAARKETKALAKEGWKTAPGALPLDKQLDKSYTMQMEYDEDLFPKYLMGEAMSIGENYGADENFRVKQRPC